MMHWEILPALLFTIHTCYAETATTPNQAATGIISSQFQGFRTPRPFPPNANFMYASVWASWSAWSFCANGVQVRVRACNTVRGFSCLGANRETKDCEQPSRPQPLPQPENITPQHHSEKNRLRPDYDVVDPWEDDRKEALRQLGQYNDYESDGKHQKPLQDLKHRSAGKTHLNTHGDSYGPRGPPVPVQPKQQNVAYGPAQAPSMTPEKLYGSKIEVPVKPISQTQPTSVKVEVPTTTQTIDNDSNPVTAPSFARSTKPEHTIVERTTTDHSTIKVEQTTVSHKEQSPSDDQNVEVSSSLQQHLKGVSVVEPTTQTPVVGVASVQEESISEILAEGQESIHNVPAKISAFVSPPPAVILLRDEEIVQTTAEPTTVSPKIEQPSAINIDTENALKWMLSNMTKAAMEAQKKEKVHHMNLDSIKLHSGEVIREDTNPRNRAFGSRIHKLPSHFVSSDSEVQIGNDQILQEELIRIKSTMNKMEIELKELEKAEREAGQQNYKPKKYSHPSIPEVKTRNYGSIELVDNEAINSAEVGQGKWSQWGAWGSCFCGKKIRTRTCQYDSYSAGCTGQSYQSKRCHSLSDPCPGKSSHSHETGLSKLHDGGVQVRPKLTTT